MAYQYERHTRRWFRWLSNRGDPRGYCPPKGWEAYAELLDYHPISGRKLVSAPQWWVLEIHNPSSPTTP